MELLIILSVLTGIGIYLLVKSYDYEILGALMSAVFGFYLIAHVLLWCFSGYNYNQLKVKRDSFSQTLEFARKNNAKFELAAITSEILKFNQELASIKYDNTLFLLKDYTDNRIEGIAPIE